MYDILTLCPFFKKESFYLQHDLYEFKKKKIRKKPTNQVKESKYFDAFIISFDDDRADITVYDVPILN